eukprot:Platyproteum_vivax@DN3824_c0_g1_i1.p1
MPRAERGTNKWLANKMKAKGLQRLRWYCQMCEKQCRDENGFKCHRMSEAHARQMIIFCQKSGGFIDGFSREFETKFMQLMKTRYYNTRVLANTVYCEHIADKEHVHMNSTCWTTLSGFVQHLGRSGQCEIEETPKGWYIKYIDNDPEKLQRDKERQARDREELDEDERQQRMINETIKAAEKAGGFQRQEFTEIQRTNSEDKVVFAFAAPRPATMVKPELRETKLSTPVFAEEKKPVHVEKKRKLTAMEKVKLEHEAKKLKQAESAKVVVKEEEKENKPWVNMGLTVKVVTKIQGGKYYKKKGDVIALENSFLAVVKMHDCGDKLKIDQADLETVIPKMGGHLIVVLGPYKGLHGTLANIDMEKFCCSIEAVSNSGTSRNIDNLKYEEICKLQTIKEQ